jgi:hypothetical protein
MYYKENTLVENILILCKHLVSKSDWFQKLRLVSFDLICFQAYVSIVIFQLNLTMQNKTTTLLRFREIGLDR